LSLAYEGDDQAGAEPRPYGLPVDVWTAAAPFGRNTWRAPLADLLGAGVAVV
jgi:hypothetical protein